MAVERQTSVVETRSEVTNFPQSTAAARELDSAISGISASSKNLTKSQIDLQGQLDRLDAKYDASIKTANEVARIQGLITARRAQGNYDEEQGARVLSAALDAHEQALRKVAGVANDNAAATTRTVTASRQAAESLRDQATAVQGLIHAWAGVKETGIDTSARAADIRAYSDALDALGPKFNAMVAAERELVRATAEINTAFANFEINILDSERALESANAAYQKSAAAVRAYYTEIDKASAKTAAAAQQKIHGQMFGVPKRADDAGLQARHDDLVAFGNELEDLRAKYNPLFAAEREFKREVEGANLALRAQLLTADEHGAALKRLESNYDRAKAAIHGAGNAAASGSKNFGLASHQLQNLGFQLNDLVVQIGSGGGVFRPLLQQGAQIQQILSMSEGGMGGVLSRVSTQLKAIGPAAIAGWGAAATAIAAATAGVVLAIKGMVDYREEIVKTQRALTTGPGRMSGIQAGDVEAAAEKASKTSKGLSTGDLRDVALEYARLGTIGKDVMSDLTGVTEAYAKTLGIDTAQAIKELGAAFNNPAEGARFLAERLNFLSGAQLEYILMLQRTEGRAAAQGQMMRELAKGPMVDLKKGIETLDEAWTAFWKNVEKGADIVVRSVAKIGAPKDLQQQLAEVEARIKAIEDAKAKALEAGSQGNLGGFGVESRGTFGGQADPDAERQKAFGEAARLRMQIEKQAQDSAQADFEKTSRAASELVLSLDPIGQKFVEMQKQATLLEDALRFPELMKDAEGAKQALERLQTGMGGATTVAEAHVVALNRAAAAHQNALAAIRAVTLEQQMAVAAETARAAAEANNATATEQATAAMRAKELVLAQANATAAQQLQQSRMAIEQIAVETQATLARTDVERQAALVAQAELTYRQTRSTLINAGIGEVNAEALAQAKANEVMASGNAARVVRMQQAELEIEQGKREAAQRQLNIQSQLAYTAAEQRAAAEAQAAAAAQNAYNAAIEAGNTPLQAETKAQQAYNAVMDEFNAKVAAAIKAADRKIASNNLQLRAIKAVTVAEQAQIAYEQSLMDTENSLMTVEQRLTLAEQERNKVLAQAEAAVQRMITAQEGELRLIEASISSINMEKSARESLLAGIRAENQLIAMGIDLNTDYAQTYIRNAEAIAKARVQLERLEEAKRRAEQAPAGPDRAFHRLPGGYGGEEENTMQSLLEKASGGGQFQVPYGRYFLGGDPGQAAEDLIKKMGGGTAAGELAAARSLKAAGSRDPLGFGADINLDAYEDAAEAAADLGDAAQTAADKLGDLGSLGAPIEQKIDTLRNLQEAALSRAYTPDPYADKNPEFFYSGERIFKEAQDRIYDGLQAQIVKLESLQASLGILVQQNEQLPQTLVNALIAAGFADIAQKIVEAFTANDAVATSATPNPTIVQSPQMGTPSMGERGTYGGFTVGSR